MPKLCALVIMAAFSLASTAAAQRPVSITLGGGGSLPQGTLRDAADPGWHAHAGIALGSLMQPIGVRLDAAYNRFSSATGGAGAVDQTITSAMLNFTYRLPMTNSPLSPYLVTGWGPHWLDCASQACDAELRYGWNAGLGTKFVFGARGFIESRFHGVTGRVRYIPITIGLIL